MSSISGYRISDQQFNKAVEKLGDYVKIPSVSNKESEHYSKENLKRAAEFAGNELKEMGFEVKYVSVNDSSPYVIAKRIQNTASATIALYAHSDVQPVDVKNWKSSPFVMEERDGRLYGRGASDDKAGVVGIISAIKASQEAGNPLPNITVLIDPEEEIGSPNLSKVLEQEAENLKAHALVVLDGLNRDKNTGTITSSTRGLANINLQVKSEKSLQDKFHLIPHSAKTFVNLLHSLKDTSAIPGFLNCEQIGDEEKEILKKSSIEPNTYAKDTGMLPNVQLRGHPNRSVYERIVNEPSMSFVNMNYRSKNFNIACGKPNGGNSIQPQATCNFNIRLSNENDGEKIVKMISDHILSQKLESNATVKISHKKNMLNPLDILFTLEVSTLEKSVHSGIGCLAPDPAQDLIDLIHSLEKLNDNKNFLALIAEQSTNDQDSQLNSKAEESNNNSNDENGNSMIGIRVLPGQNPDQIAKAVMEYLRSQEKQLKNVEIKQDEAGSWAWKAKLDAPLSKMYYKALGENFKNVCAMPCGGTLPLFKLFLDVFPEMTMIVPAVEDNDSNAHSDNESQDKDVFRWATNSLYNFLVSVGNTSIKSLGLKEL